MKHPTSCVQCGTCVSVCPAEMVGGHAIVSFMADPDTSDYSVWLCSSCWRCQEACPEGVDIFELMMSQRRLERAPAGYQTAFENVLACGLALEVPQKDLDQVRATWDLEPVRLPSPETIRVLLRRNE